MKIKIFPQKKFGIWSVVLVLLFFLFLRIFFIFVDMGERGGETFFSNLKLTIPIMIAAISGISALITGIIGIYKQKDHCILVYIAMIVGLFVLLFVLGEFIYPH